MTIITVFHGLIFIELADYLEKNFNCCFFISLIKDTNERNFYVKTSIKNNNAKKLSIIYFDTLPWYFRVFLNSLVIFKDGKLINITASNDFIKIFIANFE